MNLPNIRGHGSDVAHKTEEEILTNPIWATSEPGHTVSAP